MTEIKALAKNPYRKESTDEMIQEVSLDFDYTNYYYKRLTINKKTRFTRINFQFCTFDSCYIRDCFFESCNFTGCKFLNSNLVGSSFIDCNFQYTQFEKTFIDNDILKTEFHQYSDSENLRWKFARALRVNYQQTGDSESANKAIKVELSATRSHLKHIWSSQKPYYLEKYSKRSVKISGFIKWLFFCALDLIWGNGESLWKLVRSTILFLLSIGIINTINHGNPDSVTSYFNYFINSVPMFFGVLENNEYSELYLSVITLIRLGARQSKHIERCGNILLWFIKTNTLIVQKFLRLNLEKLLAILLQIYLLHK